MTNEWPPAEWSSWSAAQSRRPSPRGSTACDPDPRGSSPTPSAHPRRTVSATPVPSSALPPPPRRSHCWQPRQRPTTAPGPATPVDGAPTAPAPTSPTSRAHHQTGATPQLVHSSHQNTQPHTIYLRDTPLALSVANSPAY